jgi:hypothetical protein
VEHNEDWIDDVLTISKQNTVPVFVHTDGRVEVGWEGERG